MKRTTPRSSTRRRARRWRWSSGSARQGYAAAVPIASTRAGNIPGTHTLGFDAASETITLTHQARDRAAFARGALLAARWLEGRQGWFSMTDGLGL